MRNRSKNLVFTITVVLTTILVAGCDKIIENNPGFLEGKISIGPLCPVEHDPPDTSCLPTADTYKAYPVGIWSARGNSIVAQINPDLDGKFRIELEPGIYSVKLEKNVYSIGSSNLPVEVKISSGKETLLNISIDTGIR